MSGSLLLVGAPAYRTTSSTSSAGAVFVFVAEPRMAFKQRIMKPGIVRSFEFFGTAVATVCMAVQHRPPVMLQVFLCSHTCLTLGGDLQHGRFAFISAYRSWFGSTMSNVGAIYIYTIGSATLASPLVYQSVVFPPTPMTTLTYFGCSVCLFRMPLPPFLSSSLSRS